MNARIARKDFTFTAGWWSISGKADDVLTDIGCKLSVYIAVCQDGRIIVLLMDTPL